MAAPTYTTDLQNISLAQVTTGWTNIGTGAPVAETDYFINGSACIAKGGWQSAVRGNIFDFGSNITINSPNAVFIWETYWFPNLMDSEAAGGQRVIVGSASTAYRNWYVRGADTHQYGGWIPQVVDPNVGGDSDVGTPGAGAFRWFGGSCSIIAAGGTPKGNPFGIGVMRYGREFQNSDGESADPATFSGGAEFSNEINRRWGQVFLKDGAYFVQGAFVMGLAGTAVYFSDQNKAIFILNTKKVTAGFNEFVVRNAASTVNWTSITVTALGTVSRGKFTVEANAAVTLTTCVFTDMDTFVFMSNTSALGCTFRRTNAITAPGSDMTGSTIATPTVTANTSALIWNVDTNPNGLLNNMTFSKGTNAHHAIEFGTSSPLIMTLTGIDFTGFSASQNNDASIFHIKRTSGLETVTINLINCSSDVSFATSFRTDGANVSIVQNPVTFSVTVKDLETGNVIENARVMVPVTSGVNFPYQASVSITGSGTTATVTHNDHGLADNDNILIAGATRDEYNGAFTIDVTGTNTYTYTTPDTVSGTPAGGTTTATMVLLNGLTNQFGVITDERTYSGAQTVSGWVRKATGSPLYRQAPVADTISSSEGKSVTVFLQPDE